MRDDNIDDKIDENVFRMHIRKNSATLHNTNVCYWFWIFVLRSIWKISIRLILSEIWFFIHKNTSKRFRPNSLLNVDIFYFCNDNICNPLCALKRPRKCSFYHDADKRFPLNLNFHWKKWSVKTVIIILYPTVLYFSSNPTFNIPHSRTLGLWYCSLLITTGLQYFSKWVSLKYLCILGKDIQSWFIVS